MNRISPSQLLTKIKELLDCGAFEISVNNNQEGTQNIYIPYMMNDALECYLCLEHCLVTGEYLKDFKGETTVTLAAKDSEHGLIVRQGPENVFTIWFQNCHQNLTCYRYDEIGHFWVDGQEHWRRLVYILGTIYDKYEYMGESFCTAEEIRLLPLMEFAPLRAYSPIHESLDPYYRDSEDGREAMEALAAEAKDYQYLKLLKLYRKFPVRLLKNHLSKQLNHPERAALYELLGQKISAAASYYPDRNYGEELNHKIQQQRIQAANTLKGHGFVGEYPLFTNDTTQIYAIEEHPFTVLDWEHFNFRIQYMVSEGTKTDNHLHYGFFTGDGRCGRIETSLDFLDHI